MKIEIATKSYNEKRYSRPYVATLDLDGQVVQWGNWIGTHGEDGFLVIDADAGAVIMTGQKDYRGRNGTPSYGVVLPTGEIAYMTKAEAVRTLRKQQQ